MQIANDSSANGDSHIAKISIRAWLALILVVTTCSMSVLKIEVVEPLYSMSLLALGFYFGQKLPSQKAA